MKNNKCLILLSTFNGEKYLEELLDSIVIQKDVDILIRDDGSVDNTQSIIMSYSKKHNNISYYFGTNKGYASSFWDLLSHESGYEYYAFCDQDDIWLPNKVEKAIERISSLKECKPILYTSNIIPVDNSYKEQMELSFPEKRVLSVHESFQKSILPGCTFVFNNELKEIAEKYKGYMESHDWAIYNIANVFGKIIYDDKSYIYYRIHDCNAIGNKNRFQVFMVKVFRFFKKSKKTRSKFAYDFLRCYDDSIPICYREDIKQLAYYDKNTKYKIKLLFNRKFKGLIFKLYVLINRV